jgi:hypothetical protein
MDLSESAGAIEERSTAGRFHSIGRLDSYGQNVKEKETHE